MFDGQSMALPPGVSQIPRIALQHAMNQNPIMGTADAWNPNVSGGKFLVVPTNTKYDRDPLTREEWEEHLRRPCRIDEVAFFEDKLSSKEHIVFKGKGRKQQARSIHEEGVRPIGAGSVEDFAK
jgi:hypothetical protein